MVSAESVYICILFLIGCLVIWTGLVDVVFYVRGDETISSWLRRNPSWFFFPLSASMLFVAGLILHLFVFNQPTVGH